MPNTAGRIPSGATISAVVWMRKTANVGTLFPRVKVRLDSSTGTALCTATGTTALTTTLAAYTISCTTTANVTLTAASRFYVWAGVNMTAGSTTAFRGELGLEGTLNGAANSRVDIPTALPTPTITTLSPNAGPIGTTVTITGTNFRSQQLSSVVRFFNNRTATATSWSNTSIEVTVPASSATGAVTVTVAGAASAGVTFTVGNVPTIAQLSPNVGLAGTPVVITGSNFGATKGSSTVRFNGVTAATTAWSATSITATVPAAATTGPLVVTVGGAASAGVTFTVPTLTSITVSPLTATLPFLSEQQYRALGNYSDNVSRDITSSVTWASSQPAVGVVAASGRVTVLADDGGSTVSATLGSVSGAADFDAAPSRFKSVGSLSSGRIYHTATLLTDGKVLVAGGLSGSAVLKTAELYDPTTGQFTPTGSMVKKRHFHAATLLLDGTVLISGGVSFSPDEFHTSAEIYNPVSGTFSLVGDMGSVRYFHTTTRLADGTVLLDGGDGQLPPLASLLYDPISQTFAETSAPLALRYNHPEALLDDGRVLIAGAYGDPGALATSEVYNPVTGSYSAGPNMSVPRRFHTTTRLIDGRVLAVGGDDTCPAACTAEVFNAAATSAQLVGPLSVPRAWHTANLLGDGKILVVGGQANGVDTATAELFDPLSQTFMAAGAMRGTRVGHTATTLTDGTVLIVGGYGPFAAHGAELYVNGSITPLSLTVSPATAFMQLGKKRGFTVVDHLGHPRSDATWSIVGSGVATVDPETGEVTADAPGTASVMASLGGLSATAAIAVSADPPPTGSPLWTMGAAPSGVSRTVVKAAGDMADTPAMIVVDAYQAGASVHAVAIDGQSMWYTSVAGSVARVTPNDRGGVLLAMDVGCSSGVPMSLVSIDGPTGMWAWRYVGASACTADIPNTALRSDGAIVVSTAGNTSGFPAVMVLDGQLGTPLAVPQVPQSTYMQGNGQGVLGYSRVGPAMVNADSVVSMLFEKRVVGYQSPIISTSMWLMRINPDNTVTTTELATSSANTNWFPGRIIPDGQDGLIATWIDSPIGTIGLPPPQSTLRAARVLNTGGVSLYDVPLVLPIELLHPPNTLLPTNADLTLGEDGRAFVSYGSSIAAFSVAGGGLHWSHQAPSDIQVLAADASNGIVVGQGGSTVKRFDTYGAASTEQWPTSTVSYFASGHWAGLLADGTAAVFAAPPIEIATTGWFSPNMGQTDKQAPRLYVSDPSNTLGIPPNLTLQDTIRDVAVRVRTALEAELLTPFPTCNPFLNLNGSGTTGIQSLNLMVQLNAMGHALFWGNPQRTGVKLNKYVAFRGGLSGKPAVPIGVPEGWAVTFNRESTFFLYRVQFGNVWEVPWQGPRKYRGGTLHAQALTMLHEIAHVQGVIPADFGIDGAGVSNDATVDFNCRAVIESIQP